MYIIETSTGERHAVKIEPLEDGDYEKLDKNRYFFDWKIEQSQEVYKLQIQGFSDILGLVSLQRIPNEWRIHIRLLTVSRENKGQNKKFDKIAGNLIVHAAKIAVQDYAEMACVSLRPKSEIVQHYIDKYKMRTTGITLSTEVPEILDLIKEYDHGQKEI